MKKRQLSSIEVQLGELRVTVWKLYEGPLAQFVECVLRNEGLLCLDEGHVRVFRYENGYVVIKDETVILVEASQELEIENLLTIIREVKLTDIIPEASGLRILSNASLFKLLEVALDKYSQLRLRALEKIPIVATVLFCSLSSYPWVLYIENTETYESELRFYRHFINVLTDVLKMAGVEVQDQCSIIDHVHVLCPEFGTFVATILEQFDACFEASVQHHGKDRAHKYSILIPSETVWKLGISPGTRLDVRIRVIK